MATAAQHHEQVAAGPFFILPGDAAVCGPTAVGQDAGFHQMGDFVDADAVGVHVVADGVRLADEFPGSFEVAHEAGQQEHGDDPDQGIGPQRLPPPPQGKEGNAGDSQNGEMHQLAIQILPGLSAEGNGHIVEHRLGNDVVVGQAADQGRHEPEQGPAGEEFDRLGLQGTLPVGEGNAQRQCQGTGHGQGGSGAEEELG